MNMTSVLKSSGLTDPDFRSILGYLHLKKGLRSHLRPRPSWKKTQARKRRLSCKGRPFQTAASFAGGVRTAVVRFRPPIPTACVSTDIHADSELGINFQLHCFGRLQTAFAAQRRQRTAFASMGFGPGAPSTFRLGAALQGKNVVCSSISCKEINKFSR